MISEENFNLTDFDSATTEHIRLQLLSRTAATGDWLLCLRTNAVTWSAYLYEFYELSTGFDCATLFDTTTLYQEPEKQKMLTLIRQVAATNIQCSEVFKIVMKDGRIKWHTTMISPVTDKYGKVVGLYGVLQNITQKKQIEEKKSKEHFIYDYILDKLPTELVVLDKAGRYIFANDAAVKSKERRGIRIGKKQVSNNDLENWIPVSESKRSEILKHCMIEKKSVTFEEKLIDTDGTERTYMRNIYPLPNEKEDTEFLVSYGVDITASKKSELELQRMAIVAEKTNGIVMITDHAQKIIWINDSFERILGYSLEEVIGYDPADFLQGPETSPETIQEIACSLQKTGTFSGEILNYTKNGNKIWLYLDIAAVYDDSGKLINYVAVENDITLIKMAEQRHQKAMEKERELNRFKTQFVSLASHQFRTPLATIRTSMDLLELKMESSRQDPSFVELFQRHKGVMAEETTRMTELMENILDIGRIDEGKIELFKRQLPFKKFMDEFVKANIEPSGQQRQLDYHFNTVDRIIDIDEILLRNVLRNIVSNAFKYSEGKQPPELTVTLQGNAYIISVKDFGIGIPEHDQPFLFQSFYRASNAKIIPGSGLGLMIARKLIVIHGGKINFESKAGFGCTVTVQLPF